jgi:Xaa-Pro aminopeptidase
MDLLVFGDTERSPELRHELPLHVGDPFLYAEAGGRRVAVVWSIEGDRISVVEPSVEIVPSETISVDDLIEAGVD